MPSDSTEVFQEGIRFPALKLFDRGVRQDLVFEIIEANVRLPKMSLGDLNAELASVRIADVRVAEVARKSGVKRSVETFSHILATSERLSRLAIAAIPAGTYVAEDWIDGDGISNQRFPITVAVTIKGRQHRCGFHRIVFAASGPGELRAGDAGLRREDHTKSGGQPHGPVK